MSKPWVWVCAALAGTVALVFGCADASSLGVGPVAQGGGDGGSSIGVGGAGGTEGLGGRGGQGGQDGGGGGGGGGALMPSCAASFHPEPDSICTWLCDDSLWIDVPVAPIADCRASEALPEQIPFPALEWEAGDLGREEASLVDTLLLEWKVASEASLSTELGRDGHHAMLQVLHVQSCGESRFDIKRLIDLATGQTVGVYRMSGRCGSGRFAGESSQVGGIFSTKTAHGLFGGRRVGETRWTWWAEPWELTAVYNIYDLADGTLVFRNPSSVRVALARDSKVLTQIDGFHTAGSAADDIFVWSKLLDDAGSRVRSWSPAGGVKDLLDLPGDSCQVAADSEHVAGIMAVGNCLSFVKDLRFWRAPREPSNSETNHLVEGPAISSDVPLAINGFRFLGDHAVVALMDEPGDPFKVVVRFSDQTLWRIDAREGFAHYVHTLTAEHLYLVEVEAGKAGAHLTTIQRLPLAELESFATRL